MRKTIMIVDDDAISLAIAKELLMGDYEIAAMQSGLEALGYMEGHAKPDLILLDMIMPGTSGMDVLKELKSNPELSHIPVIFLTSMEGVDFEIEGYINGVADFMQKPIHAELLKLKIKRQFYIQQLRQENQFLQEKIQNIRLRLEDIFD